MYNRVLYIFKKLYRSIWLFPVVLTTLLLLATALRLNGSSIGVYYSSFYGTRNDPGLVVGAPRTIRSDEYGVNTQMTIAQANNNFQRINRNIGNGEDMSVYLDVPYKDWSAVFKPHNLVFFVLPLQFAFAFKWWFMGYLLILSCYFFVLELLPKKRLLAAMISISLFFSPFVQWWYQYITIGPLYYSLFAGVALIRITRTTTLRHAIWWGLLLAYIGVCFALVLYPPFQIPCGLMLAIFSLGFLFQYFRKKTWKVWLPKISVIVGSVILAGLIFLLFIFTRLSVVRAYENTAYPGHRLTQSGDYNLPHLLSGNMEFQFQFGSKAAHYQIPVIGITNQSEASTFIFLLPFLFLPCLYLIVEDFKKHKATDWPLVLVNLAFIFSLLWLFVPHLNLLGKLLLLDRVPLNRFIIGLGLLNIIQLVLFIKRNKDFSLTKIKKNGVIIYSILVLAVELVLDFHAKSTFPGFIGEYRAVAFALPIPIIIFCLLRRYYKLALVGFLAFSIFSAGIVNPIYRGTSVLTKTPLSLDIKKIAAEDPKAKWVIEDSFVANFASMNGVPSLNGVYSYPQLGLWKPLNTGDESYIYNRYAYVIINFNRNYNPVPTTLSLPAPDHFAVETDPCSSYLQEEDVHFAITAVPLNPANSCLKLLNTVQYPTVNFYIYSLY